MAARRIKQWLCRRTVSSGGGLVGLSVQALAGSREGSGFLGLGSRAGCGRVVVVFVAVGGGVGVVWMADKAVCAKDVFDLMLRGLGQRWPRRGGFETLRVGVLAVGWNAGSPPFSSRDARNVAAEREGERAGVDSRGDGGQRR